ncbi:MAG: PHB depolymerase family esterase [Myxococcota bacterium]
MTWLWIGLLACAPCEDDRDCSVSNGRYEFWTPAGWDETSALPVLTYFHGYQGSPSAIRADGDLMAQLSDAGVALLLPIGRDQRWNVRLREGERDELAFMDSVLADVGARWPIDRARIYASGFSIGGSMASLLGCYRSDDYAAIAPMSGTFWDPMPTDCDPGPMPMQHTHGTADETWPWMGRSFSETTAQGAVEDGVSVWRAVNGCTDQTVTETNGPLTCTVWTTCDGDADVRMCLHDGGHERRSGWPARQLGWMLQFPTSEN